MRRTPRRRGMAALDAVICAVVMMLIGASAYALARTALGRYAQTLGSAVGSPTL